MKNPFVADQHRPQQNALIAGLPAVERERLAKDLERVPLTAMASSRRIRDRSEVDIGRECREGPVYNGDGFVLSGHAAAVVYPIGSKAREEGLSIG
jgi:hypothetical protein